MEKVRTGTLDPDMVDEPLRIKSVRYEFGCMMGSEMMLPKEPVLLVGRGPPFSEFPFLSFLFDRRM